MVPRPSYLVVSNIPPRMVRAKQPAFVMPLNMTFAVITSPLAGRIFLR